MAGASKRRRSYDGAVRKKARATMTKRVGTTANVYRMRFTWSPGIIGPFSSPPTLAQCWHTIRPTLANLPSGQLTEVSGLFDAYKITSFAVTYLPRTTDFDGGASSVNPAPILSFVTDNDNTLLPAGVYDRATYNDFLSRTNAVVKHRVLDKPIKIVQKNPMAVNNSGEKHPFPWTNISSNTLQAYGIDTFIHATNFANFPPVTEFDVIWEVDITFRGKR